jgi:hypothetical protein
MSRHRKIASFRDQLINYHRIDAARERYAHTANRRYRAHARHLNLARDNRGPCTTRICCSILTAVDWKCPQAGHW